MVVLCLDISLSTSGGLIFKIFCSRWILTKWYQLQEIADPFKASNVNSKMYHPTCLESYWVRKKMTSHVSIISAVVSLRKRPPGLLHKHQHVMSLIRKRTTLEPTVCVSDLTLLSSLACLGEIQEVIHVHQLGLHPQIITG